MVKRTFAYFSLIAVSVIMTTVLHIYSGGIQAVEPIRDISSEPAIMNVVLVPLDSRPPCTQYVQQLGILANYNIILPPTALLDNYKTPANKHALREWLHYEAKRADVAIVSIDMLVHGGLLASRMNSGNLDDVAEVINLLENLRVENPRLKLYAFNIIPRLLIADSPHNTAFQKKMLKYSVLKNQIQIFENPVDFKKLIELEQEIPSVMIGNYLGMYDASEKTSRNLIELVNKQILDGLVIGQDDGAPFGIPNTIKDRLQQHLAQYPELAGKVFITRGTDEIAVSMLAHIFAKNTGYHPRIYVAYTSTDAAGIIMPFMPHSVETTVREKIALAEGIRVNSSDDADFTLYLHIGTGKTRETDLTAAAHALQNLINTGHKVALVDLSENYDVNATLFPVLLRHQVPVMNLSAYAGWNTTSNSIGTAITQACLFTASLAGAKTSDKIIALHKSNWEFLTARFMDDLYYQKDVQPGVNKWLRAMGIDAYNLGTHYFAINNIIETRLKGKAANFFHQILENRPLTIFNGRERIDLAATAFYLDAHLPWDRTFEVRLKTSLDLAHYKNLKN